jgi:hypothetical protein
MADHGVVCSMSRSGNVWDNAAMESFFSSLKTERTARKLYRTRDELKADVFDYVERFYDPKRRHSTIGYLSPMEFERKAGLSACQRNRVQAKCQVSPQCIDPRRCELLRQRQRSKPGNVEPTGMRPATYQVSSPLLCWNPSTLGGE